MGFLKDSRQFPWVLATRPSLRKREIAVVAGFGVVLRCSPASDSAGCVVSLRLCGTGITSVCIRNLTWALSANRSLIELDLDHNQLGDSGVSQLCAALIRPDCKIHTL
eukprot:g23905.t1